MDQSFYVGNRNRIYEDMQTGELMVLFSGVPIHKSADAFYLFYANRNFVYLTGIEQANTVLCAHKAEDGHVDEILYILPKDLMSERWNGKRLSREEAMDISGICDIRNLAQWESDVDALLTSGVCSRICLDLHRQNPTDQDEQGHVYSNKLRQHYDQLEIANVSKRIHKARTIKQPCEIDALRKAEEMTQSGILAMMKASKPGMYEYQYKAEFDRALGQYGPKEAGFQSIISAGKNNFCIHYEAYTGQAQDGDMILNDVGAQYDNLIVDVSRGWPCNGKFTEKQKILYQCALKTSDYVFSIIRPGMKMADVDRTIRQYNAERMVEAGVMTSVEEIGTYMWHGGAHHIGFDVHDAVVMPEVIQPGMVFCVDVGIYHEEWGIGFRLEDNCLVTENGCENLSAFIPRTIEEIEAIMAQRD